MTVSTACLAMLFDLLHVLLVEGDRTYADRLQAALPGSSPVVELSRAGSLAEALRLLDERRVDAVLVDLDTPGVSGFEAVLRLLAARPGLPVLVLTSVADAEVALAAAQHGAQDYLVKSEIDGRWLWRAVQYAVERAGIKSELVRRERYYRALIEDAHDLVVVLSPEGRLTYQSPSVERMLGHRAADLAGTSVLDLIHPDDRVRAAEILHTRPLPTGDAGTFRFRLRHKDGRWRVIEALGRELADDPQHGVVVNARDVTERAAAEEEVRATEAKLRQAHRMEAVGRLAGGIAHDFNNVLTAIYGYADLLMEQFAPEDPRKGDVAEIRRAAERAAELTRQLLAFSRQQMLNPQVLDLNAVVDEVQRMLGRILGPDVRISFEPAPGLWPVRADKVQIAQVLMNLGTNARDAMPDGGDLVIRTGNRSITADEAYSLPGLSPGHHVCLTVADSGTGMPESVRRHVFEPFFTTKEPGQGTGLGLATVYGIVKQSGGGIYVDSAEGNGTTFSIFLPPHTTTSAP